jgi:hypothetical protein
MYAVRAALRSPVRVSCNSGTEWRSRGDGRLCPDGTAPHIGRSLTMLWTILIILAIIALAIFIIGRVRGGRGV